MTEVQGSDAFARAAGQPVGGKLERLFKVLKPDLRRAMERIWHHETVAEDATLVEEGEEARKIGYVVDGLLAMVKELPDGRRHIIGLLTPGDLFGRAFNGPFGYRIVALTDTDVMTADRSKFEEILSQSHEAERLFLLTVLDELDSAREWVMVLGGAKVVERLASFLLILCRHKLREDCRMPRRGEPPLSLHLHLSRTTIAQYLGATPESLSRALHKLARDGLIRINTPYQIDLLDLGGLVETAGSALLVRDL